MNELEFKKYEKMIENNKSINTKEKEKYFQKLLKLKNNNVRIILNSYHFSNLVGIKWEYLKKIIDNPEKYYHKFYISKKSGGKREICSPSLPLELCQRYIKEEILDKIAISEKANGFAKNKSIITNAKMHLNKEMVLNIDLKDFFPSIGKKKVFYIFNKICGYDSSLSHCFSKLVMYNDGLPQGACTSPIISNIVSYKMDYRLMKLSEKLGITYTRYADDMTFSGTKKVINKRLLEMLEKIINECGYTINSKKTRFQYKSSRQEVTGLIVNNDKVSIPRAYEKVLRQELYYIKKYGIIEHKKRKEIYNRFYKEHIKGKIMFIYSINKEKGKKYLNEYNEIFENNGML